LITLAINNSKYYQAMKRSLSILLISATILSGCSKKNNNSQSATSFTISGKSYSTVKIGSQTWTSENYDGSGGLSYNNDASNDATYGKLYSYSEAEGIKLPAGWRLPTRSDFETLLVTMGATQTNGYYTLSDTLALKLMSKTTWAFKNGTNTSGFNAVASGLWSNGFRNLGNMTNLLSSSLFPNGDHISLEIFQTQYQVLIDLNAVIPNETDRGSIRFVRDN
jgi:uncharacterized protein (TIGR02145 family)